MPTIPPELLVQSPRRPYGRADLLMQLRFQCDLLREFVARSEGDPRMLGEVATKVRLLACRFGRARHENKPLLIDLMQAYGMALDVPMPNGDVTLSDYMSLVALQIQRPIRTASGGYRFEWSELKVHEFVRAWAEQAGGAHQDWEMDDWLAIGFRVGAQSRHNSELQKIANVVLGVADGFFKGLEVRHKRTGSYEPIEIAAAGPPAMSTSK